MNIYKAIFGDELSPIIWFIWPIFFWSTHVFGRKYFVHGPDFKKSREIPKNREISENWYILKPIYPTSRIVSGVSPFFYFLNPIHE